MRFILIAIRDERCVLQRWRATCCKNDGGHIDIWFHANSIETAKMLVRSKYPDAYFSDEKLN